MPPTTLNSEEPVKHVPCDAISVLNPIIEALIRRTVAEKNLRYQTAKYVVLVGESALF